MNSEDGQPALEASEALVARTEVHKLSKRPNEHLQKHSMPAGLDYEELGGLSDPGQWDCSQARNILE